MWCLLSPSFLLLTILHQPSPSSISLFLPPPPLKNANKLRFLFYVFVFAVIENQSISSTNFIYFQKILIDFNGFYVRIDKPMFLPVFFYYYFIIIFTLIEIWIWILIRILILLFLMYFDLEKSFLSCTFLFEILLRRQNIKYETLNRVSERGKG